jgi:hypothetical protein
VFDERGNYVTFKEEKGTTPTASDCLEIVMASAKEFELKYPKCKLKITSTYE